MFKSGPWLSTGCKLLIFKDRLLQSIPFMTLRFAMREEDEQVLGLSPLFYFTLAVKGLGLNRRWAHLVF
jgi:hypothetical protein